MVQRVRIAQAPITDPQVVFLDEPMSVLDPLGRRLVRELILQLRDRGCAVFFSSHVLSDAEALCSRVAILANGRLVASGRLNELTELKVRGWELVVADVRPEVLNRIAPRVGRATRIGEGRFALELPLSAAPEPLIADLAAAGARVVSLNPLRETLEDVFVQHVNTPSRLAGDRASA